MKIKKFLALLLAGIMALGCLAIPVSADEGDSYDLFIAFGGDPADSTDWAYQYYGEGGDNKGDVVAANETIAVGETKTISLTLPAEAATTYFIAPCLVAGEDYKQLDFDVKVSIDGTDVTDQLDFEVDAEEDSRKWWYEDTGNFKGNCIRLAGGFNTYAANRSYLKEMPAFTTVEYTVTLNSISTEEPEGGSDEPADDTPAVEFDPSSDEYVAQMYIQVGGSWVFRNTYSDADYGTVTDYEYKNQLSDVQDAANPVAHDGTFTDVVLKGNGTYTVTLENPDFTNGSGTAGELFNLIGLSTSIPASAEETVKITDMTIQVNDSAMLKYTYSEAEYDPDGIKAGYLNVLGVNIWNSEVCTDANAVFGEASNWPGEVSKVTITFTVSGFDHDAPAGGDDAETSGDDANETKADGATSADNNNDKKDDSKGGLPTAAIIGIIAGVVVIVVIIVVVATVAKKKKSN